MPLFPLHFRDLLHGATGWNPSLVQLRQAGERIWNLERLFNLREGLGREDDLPPHRLTEDPIATGPSQGERLDPERFAAMLDAYYDERGWHRSTGAPSPEKLAELNLSDEKE